MKIISCRQAKVKYEYTLHNLLTLIIYNLFYIILIKNSFKGIVGRCAVCENGISWSHSLLFWNLFVSVTLIWQFPDCFYNGALQFI